MAGETLKERVSRLEEIVGNWNSEEGTVFAWSAHVSNELNAQRDLAESHAKHVEGELVERKAEVQSGIEELRRMMESLQVDVAVFKKAMLQGYPSYADASLKVRVPEPKGFSGNRNVKELGNFLWDMEQFFKAAHVPDSEKVSITNMYLIGDPKLWWCTRVREDSEVGSPQVAKWETLEKELKDQFLLTNARWLAKESLRGMKHKDSVRDYVKEFSSLMLKIRNMSDEDKLFNFISRL